MLYDALVQLLFAFSIMFTVYYSDRRDREPFAMIVTILALALCLSTVALFPVDIFLVSRILDPSTGLRREWATNEAIANMQSVVRLVYYGTLQRLLGHPTTPSRSGQINPSRKPRLTPSYIVFFSSLTFSPLMLRLFIVLPPCVVLLSPPFSAFLRGIPPPDFKPFTTSKPISQSPMA